MTANRFDLQREIEHEYAAARPHLAYAATSPGDHAVWRARMRGKLIELLGLSGWEPPAAPEAERLHAIRREGYVEEKYALRVGDDVEAPIYVLVPEGEPPFKAVLVFHGHNPSVQYILGNYPDEETAAAKRALDNNYAQALAQAGYLVCAVEQRGFGERQSTTYNGRVAWSCRHVAFNYMMLGKTIIGERCKDGMAAASYVLWRDDVAKGTLGCTGNSGGGTTTLFLSAVEERITVSVPSCFFCSFKHSLMDVYHCECNYVPGIVQWAEMGDVAALIAPRAFQPIAGEQDGLFPIHAVREQFETVKRAYGVLGAPEKCSLAVHPGPHAYNHALSRDWFGEWL